MSFWKSLLLLVKIIVLIYLFYYLYVHFFTQKEFIYNIKNQLFNHYTFNQYCYLFLAILLLPINWLLETYKWYLLQKNSIQQSFFQSWKNVMKGVTYGILMPQQIGDALGKMEENSTGKKIDIGVLSLFGGFIQSYIALLGGALGFIILKPQIVGFEIQLTVSISLIIILLFILFISKILNIKIASKFKLKALHSLNIKIITQVLLIAFLRYLVFVFQFLLILKIFVGNFDNVKIFSAVMLTYLGKTFIPALNILGDLGTREFAALTSFSLTNISSHLVFLSSMLVWIINILIPVFVGAYYLIKTENLRQNM